MMQDNGEPKAVSAIDVDQINIELSDTNSETKLSTTAKPFSCNNLGFHS